ncbi:Toll/interleukin-1 receptor domain-containing protein [Tanacetum coccineum]
MPWRHPGSCVNDLVPKIGFNPEDVKKLGEFVVKLRNIPMGVLVILGLSRAWWNHRCDPVIREGNNVDGSEVQAEAHGLSCVIQERILNNTTLPDAPRIVIPTPRATRAKSSYQKRHARRSYRADSGFRNNTTSLDASRTAIPDRAPEQLEVTLRAKRFWPELKPPESKKPLLPWGFQLKVLIEIDLLEGAREQIELRKGGMLVVKLCNHHKRSIPDLTLEALVLNQVAVDAPLNGNDYEIDGGNDHSHDGCHPSTITVLSIEKIFPSFFLFIFLSIFSLTPYNEVDVENHEEPEQASSVPNDTSDRIEREIASPAPKRSAVCQAMVDQLPTHVDLFCVEGLNDDQLMDRVNVLHCQKMIHEGELVARFWGLLRQYEDLRTSNRTIATSLANDKEKSKGRKKLVRCQEKTIGKLTTEAQSELEIMTSDVKDLKKSLAERESELLGLKDEILTSRSIGPSSFNFLSIFFQGFQTCQVSVEALEPEKLPIASSSKVSESAPEEVSSNVIGYHQDDVCVLVASTTSNARTNTMNTSGFDQCRNFHRGNCTYGARCKFVHGIHDARPIPLPTDKASSTPSGTTVRYPPSTNNKVLHASKASGNHTLQKAQGLCILVTVAVMEVALL